VRSSPATIKGLRDELSVHRPPQSWQARFPTGIEIVFQEDKSTIEPSARKYAVGQHLMQFCFADT
jgi:hypothetical protein